MDEKTRRYIGCTDSGWGPAHTVTITNDHGGYPHEYWDRWLAYAQSRERVEIVAQKRRAATKLAAEISAINQVGENAG